MKTFIVFTIFVLCNVAILKASKDFKNQDFVFSSLKKTISVQDESIYQITCIGDKCPKNFNQKEPEILISCEKRTKEWDCSIGETSLSGGYAISCEQPTTTTPTCVGEHCYVLGSCSLEVEHWVFGY